MTQNTQASDSEPALRLDRLLVYLRFARTRSAANAMIEKGALRHNRHHVRRAREAVKAGDVLTLVQGEDIRIVEILSLPNRRASPAAAKKHYREHSRM